MTLGLGCTSDFLVEESLDNFVVVHGSGPLDDLLKIIEAYREKGFNFAWYGQENSTVCIGKVEEC